MGNDSPAARFNVAAIKKLQKALDADPEVDLISALPMDYAERLAGRKTLKGNVTPSYSRVSKAHTSREARCGA